MISRNDIFRPDPGTIPLQPRNSPPSDAPAAFPHPDSAPFCTRRALLGADASLSQPSGPSPSGARVFCAFGAGLAPISRKFPGENDRKPSDVIFEEQGKLAYKAADGALGGGFLPLFAAALGRFLTGAGKARPAGPVKADRHRKGASRISIGLS